MRAAALARAALAAALLWLSAAQTVRRSRPHLVVIVHGVLGSSGDLSLLATRLTDEGFIVLKSKSNENLKSLRGVKEAAWNLRQEIATAVELLPHLREISFVGNSLGGLFARNLLRYVFDKEDRTCMGLDPSLFVTIATPHLGVRHHTFVDEFGIRVPFAAKRLVSKLLQRSGEHMFGTDAAVFNESLIYEMATCEEFLLPLTAFKQRRLYANVELDLMVPLGTGAVLGDDVVDAVRTAHRDERGIVAILRSPEDERKYLTSHRHPRLPKWRSALAEAEQRHMEAMRTGLNSVGWDKVLVLFQGRWPNAHDKICALTKYGDIVDRLLGFPDGRFVVEHVAEWFVRSSSGGAGKGKGKGGRGGGEKVDDVSIT